METVGGAGEAFCYITTTGRRTGRPHIIEIWFAAAGRTLYALSGSERTDWVRNLRADPAAGLRLAGTDYETRARFPAPGSEEDALARRLVLEKYDPSGRDGLAGWTRSALAVAFDV